MSIESYPLVSDWLNVVDGKLQVRTGKVDIGQRISTALIGIAGHELSLPYALIDVQTVRTSNSPDEGMTSGSNSIEQSGRAVRLASATLRQAVIEHAANKLGGEPRDWSVDAGYLAGPATNHPLPVLDLVAELDLAIPIREDVALLPGGDAVSMPMRGLPELVTGTYCFVHDLDVPGMLHARVVRPPHARAHLRSLDDGAVESIESHGHRVIRDGSFLAVVGEQEWPVIRAALRLANLANWDSGDGLPESDIFSDLRPENAIRLILTDGTPQKGADIPDMISGVTHSARYERPFTMHGALAPSAAMATWDGARLDVICHSQGIYILRNSIAESLGLEPDEVVLSHMPGSGCYGHNGADDAAFDAALIAMAIPGTPILLKWSREDEHAWEPYGPASAVELAARVATDGRLEAISAETIGGTYRGRPRGGKNQEGPAKLLANNFRQQVVAPQRASPNMNRQGGLQRNLNPIYDIPETRYVKNLLPEVPLRTSALRCLGAALNVFAIESFVDEIICEKGLDPFDYRRRHLSDARAIAVMDRLERDLAERPRPDGAGRGIAYGQYKNEMTRVGLAVDLVVTDAAEIRLNQVIVVADAGRIVDRDGLVAQLEGGVLQAASWALHEEVTWDRDGVTSRDWDSYPVLHFAEVPDIHVTLIDRPDEKSVGAGEAAPGPALAAIANAVHGATGLRLRRLPFTADAVTKAALAV